MDSKIKFLVVGWDGATFDILTPLINQGRLPNLTSIMQNGVWGRLISSIPPLTPTAWTSISTGVNPGKHGIFDAILFNQPEQRVCFANATYRKVKPVWSILSERGKRVGVMNVPLTYPPDKIDGFVIPGMFTPNELTDFIHPSKLHSELKRKFGRYMIECRQDDDPEIYLNLIFNMINFREDVALYMMEKHPVDFFFVTFIASDRVQHFFWKYLDSTHPEHLKHSNSISKVYERLDESLGMLLEKVGPNTNIMMVSDHGSGPLNYAFFLNNWLIKNGYLFLKHDPIKSFRSKKSSIIKTLTKKITKNLVPDLFINRFKQKRAKRIQSDINLFLSLIDWEKTIAFSEGVGGAIFINPQIVTSKKYKEILNILIDHLKDIVGPDGTNVVKDVHIRSEIYVGDHVNKAPDLILSCNAGYQVIAPNEFLYFNKKYEDELFIPHRWSSRHEQDGIFLLKGPDILKGKEIDCCNVIDIAPTILYLMGESIPDYMDGKVLKNTLVGEYKPLIPEKYDSSYEMLLEKSQRKLTDEEEKEILERLINLGYME